MTKLLNLDDFAEETREVRLSGKTFTVRSMNVGEFIAQAKSEELEEVSRKAAGLGEPTTFEKLEALLQRLPKFIDGLSNEDLAKLSFKQLTKLMEFVRGEDEAVKTAEANKAPL